MPIKIPDNLPAFSVLNNENIFVMTSGKADKQDIRPLKIAILNLMPKKIETETQLARLLGNTPLQVEPELIRTTTHQSKNVSEEHLLSFYKTFADVKNNYFDGMIITGAPVEHMEFEEVDYWNELCEIMEWSKSHVHSTLHICWGAQAGLYYHYGVKKYSVPEKIFGIYPHKVEYKSSILFRGFDDVFMVPQSRHTTVFREDVEKVEGLKILASSDETGVYAMSSKNGRQIFITGHSEYDVDTLKNEYERDVSQGKTIKIPYNYFPNDDPSKTPMVTWRAHANLLFSNWLNYFVYQSTPFDVTQVDELKKQI